jgi:hypothetical protein
MATYRLRVCARPSTPWQDVSAGGQDGAMALVDDELEAQVARSLWRSEPIDYR